MKYLKIIIVTVTLALSASSLIAQDELYKKYSGVEGVTKIYISEAMFSLLKGTDLISVASGASDVVDIGEIVESLTGLYILSCNDQLISGKMEKDFDRLIQKLKLELLMEVEDNSDIVKMYTVRKGKVIKNFFMKVKDKSGSLTIMFFKGEIPEAELSKIIISIDD